MEPTPEKLQFYAALDMEYRSCFANAGKIIFGDLNARVRRARNGEEHSMGDYGWGREAIHAVETPKRDLLIEFCDGLDLKISH
eukprot:8610053-Pyramimonas_sp.AAC.1